MRNDPTSLLIRQLHPVDDLFSDNVMMTRRLFQLPTALLRGGGKGGGGKATHLKKKKKKKKIAEVQHSESVTRRNGGRRFSRDGAETQLEM